MTAVCEHQTDNRSTCTLISDVNVKRLVNAVTVYYNSVSQFSHPEPAGKATSTSSSPGNTGMIVRQLILIILILQPRFYTFTSLPVETKSIPSTSGTSSNLARQHPDRTQLDERKEE
ncbi:hypothetical protein FHK02_4136 [Spirosoma sp. LMG 31448]|uniref:Uncharacterized protein n=1 Tax=Spirosoma utsteinense TaxID=2585773 RepID=A0ABR6WAA5_9BACT|nr:hypothetical protein [Spirosoma utsteinense]MBC3793204.1 hypothetical protein [Spirosoma utsteinense]